MNAIGQSNSTECNETAVLLEEAEFLKPRLIRLGNSGGSIDSLGFELLSPQFARVRDMR